MADSEESVWKWVVGIFTIPASIFAGLFGAMNVRIKRNEADIQDLRAIVKETTQALADLDRDLSAQSSDIKTLVNWVNRQES